MNTADFNIKSYGTGMPIIMLHGFQLDQTSMIAAFEPILQDKPYQRIYLDLPGMGLNQNTEGMHNADDMMRAIINVINTTISNAPFCLVGMSYGGYLARGVAQQLSDRCKGMFLFVPVVYPRFNERMLPQHEVVFEDTAFTETLNETQLNELREMSVIINAHTVQRQQEEIDTAIMRGNAAFLEQFQLNGYQATFDVDRVSDQFNYPVMFLAGKQDAVVGYEDQFRLSQKYKRATYIAIDGAGHGLHYEQESAFNACVNLWLSQVRP